MKIHTDEKENFKKKVDRMKDETARKNRELQKKNQARKSQGR